MSKNKVHWVDKLGLADNISTLASTHRESNLVNTMVCVSFYCCDCSYSSTYMVIKIDTIMRIVNVNSIKPIKTLLKKHMSYTHLNMHTLHSCCYTITTTLLELT